MTIEADIIKGMDELEFTRYVERKVQHLAQRIGSHYSGAPETAELRIILNERIIRLLEKEQ